MPQLKRLRIDLRYLFTQASENTSPLIKYVKTEISDSYDTNRLLLYN